MALALAVLGCGHGNGSAGDGEVTRPEPPGTTSTSSSDGSSEGPWEPAETDPECGCEDAEGDESDGTGDPGSDGGGFDGADGSGDGGDGGGDGGDLWLPPAQGRHAASRGLTVPSGSTLRGAACVHGIVADEAGRRIAGAVVSTGSAVGVGQPGTAVSTSAGHFCVKLAPQQAASWIALTVPVASGRERAIRVELSPIVRAPARRCVQLGTIVLAR